MTPEDKITVFQTVDALVSEIIVDRSSMDILKNRYAVRFIILDNFNVFQELSLKLTELNVNTFGIESLLSPDNKDRWITQDELKNAIKNINHSTIVSPFSEVVRFYNEEKFTTFFNEIALLQNSQYQLNRRIYIPLIGLESRFVKFLSSFGRIEESAPIWAIKIGIPQPVIIYLTPSIDSAKGYDFPRLYRGLETMYDWLLFWKTKAPTEKIICSSLPININYKYSQPDNIFDIKAIETAYEFITQFLNIHIDIEYRASDEYFWIQLLSLLENKKGNVFSFKSFVEEHFNVYKLSIKELLNKWISTETTDFDRWLLKHYYLHYLSDNEYLNGIIKDCVDYTSSKLVREISLSIFAKAHTKKLIEERNSLLNLFSGQYKFSESDLSEMKLRILDIATLDIEKAISLCSGRFDFEKELFLDWYRIGKLKIINLAKLYPDLAAYISDIKFDSWANLYIQAYKQAKIEDKYTDEIRNYIAIKNANEDKFYNWYHNFDLSIELLAKEKPDKIYWIDALGIEYLSLINEIINKSNFRIKKLLIAKTGIPSSTEHNKFDNAEKIDDLDNFIHNNLYKYPQTICKEIEIIKSIFMRILNQTTETTIVIASDHGLTALSRLVDSKKYSAKASHEGRYIKLGSTDCLEDSDYIRYEKSDNIFKVALTHCSLNTKPVREVHGGCTPEEVLVPFLVLSNKKEKDAYLPKHNKMQTISSDKKQKNNIGFEEEDLF
jgi:hypothetical protein